MENIIYTAAAIGNLISLIIGITFGLLLIFSNRNNQQANRFIGLISIIFALWQCWVLVTTNLLLGDWLFLNWIPFSCLLAIGPCLYFYTKFSSSNSKFKGVYFIHFLPLFIELIMFFMFRPKINFDNYQTYTITDFRFVVQPLAAVSVVCYSYFSIRLINRNNQENDVDGSINLKWWKQSILIFSTLWLAWIPYALINTLFFNYYVSDYDLYPLHLLIWFFTLWMSVKIFLRPEVVIIEKVPVRERLPKIASIEVIAKANWLKEKMELEKYYLNPDLTLQSLASELGLHGNVISQVINEGLQKSFSDFVNDYRIDCVVEKLNNSEYSNITILGMAYDSGFNSKTTFNRAFKKSKGKSPLKFKEELQRT